MSPLSDDANRRARQLANLRRGVTVPPAGNQRAVTHGAYAVIAHDRIDVKVREVFDALAQDVPLRAADGGLPHADGAAVRLAAEVMCRLDNVRDYLERRGIEDDAGELRTGTLELEGRLRREAADHLDALGCTPRSRARLGVDLVRTVDLAAEMAKLAWDDEVIDG